MRYFIKDLRQKLIEYAYSRWSKSDRGLSDGYTILLPIPSDLPVFLSLAPEIIERLLVVIDEYTRESLAIDVARHFSGQDVVELLRYLVAVRGCPAYIRSDNGPEFISSAVHKWLEKAGVETLYIAPGSP